MKYLVYLEVLTFVAILIALAVWANATGVARMEDFLSQ